MICKTPTTCDSGCQELHFCLIESGGRKYLLLAKKGTNIAKNLAPYTHVFPPVCRFWRKCEQIMRLTTGNSAKGTVFWVWFLHASKLWRNWSAVAKLRSSWKQTPKIWFAKKSNGSLSHLRWTFETYTNNFVSETTDIVTKFLNVSSNTKIEEFLRLAQLQKAPFLFKTAIFVKVKQDRSSIRHLFFHNHETKSYIRPETARNSRQHSTKTMDSETLETS